MLEFELEQDLRALPLLVHTHEAREKDFARKQRCRNAANEHER